MKIIFHEKFLNDSYAMDPAAAPGRLDGIVKIIKNKEEYEIISPEPASKEDILRAHTKRHFDRVKNDRLLFEMASLAAGGAIRAAQEAYKGNPTFAVIRPPGHHASADSAWGFCYFNNIAISLLKLFSEGKIKSAFVLDFDLHTGDGNIQILNNRVDGFDVDILNPAASDRTEYLEEVNNYMESLDNADIFVASAGFDEYEKDWGHKLTTEDYNKIGTLMKKYSNNLCAGKRYALLEGGYYHEDLGLNVDSFCKGFR